MVVGQSSRSGEESVARVIGATSSEGLVIRGTNTVRILLNVILVPLRDWAGILQHSEHL